MVEVYILASKGKSWKSWPIRFWQFGYPYTHVAYIIGQDFDDPFVIEAWWPRVRFGKFSEAHTSGTEFTVFAVKVSPEQKDIIETFLFNQVNKPYDVLGLLNFPFRTTKLQRRRAWFCSELLFVAFHIAGVKLLRDTKPAEVSPRLFLKSPFLEPIYTGRSQ